MERAKITLELAGEAAAALERLADRLRLSPTATIYHALSVLNRAVFPPLVPAAVATVQRPAEPAKRPIKPSPHPRKAGEVDEALGIAEEIQSLADQIPPGGEDFAASVSEKAADIAATIEVQDRVTEAQLEALENMLDGLRRWFRD